MTHPTGPFNHEPILVAFPKGRLGDELLSRLAGTSLALEEAALNSRVLRIPTARPDVQVLLLKGADLPRYVAAGVASLGIVGSDTLDEMDVDLLELADLKFGWCRLSLCGVKGLTIEALKQKPHLRLATKFLKATADWLKREGLTAELVPLQSSVELAPILGLADAIVDLVQTGETLKAHGLSEIKVLGTTSARLVAARVAYLADPERLRPLISEIIGLLSKE